MHFLFADETIQYKIELTPDEADGMYPSLEVVYYWDRGSSPHPQHVPLGPWQGEAGISVSEEQRPYIPLIQNVQNHLDRWRPYHFHDTSTASPMKKNADINDNRRLRPDGSNLAAFLFLLREKHGEAYELIRRTIRLVAPFFEDFHLEPLALNEDKIRLEWKHRGTDAYFDSSSLSDGTLRFMALATLLLQPPSRRPSVIIVDEPELGLHPSAVTLLASLVKQAATETQIVLATQSSLLLDHFSPDDVLVANRVKGSTEFTRLKTEELREWLDEYSLGQLWEKNELGGRPAPEA